MENTINPLKSVASAIFLGCVILSIAILMHGGIIKLGKPATSTTPAVTPTAVGQPQQPKTEIQIVEGLKGLASNLGLDTNKFNSCLDSAEKSSLVKADLDDGTKAGVNGTPAFFINGRLISGAVPFEQFKSVIDEELNGNAPSTTQRVTVGNGDLPVQGNQSAKVTLIEFSDYQCPFCGRHFTQTEGQLKKEYIDTGKVKFYYRDFPLSQIHPGAQKAAEAARCAGDQSKYWEYHDLVFTNQQNIF
ncbi:thioredoxin domain-containing protein [Candidatus Microgenomates bacterium]|nr:thioredoxin domain-containing protein [Candidatus Microgenomates bacterium]